MKEQHYKNHRQLVFTFHIFTGLALIALLIGAVRNVIYCNRENLFVAYLLLLMSFILLSLFLHLRSFVTKVQDRAIRAEEAIRYFVLTGKQLDTRLSIQQIVALRFASDEELPNLAQQAVAENLSNDGIKQRIKIWRSDFYRV